MVDVTYTDDKGKERVSIPGVIKALMNDNHLEFATIFGNKVEEIYIKEGYIWTRKGREVIHTTVEDMLGSFCSNHIIKEVEAKVKRITAISREEFERVDPDLFCVENGVLNLITHELIFPEENNYFKSKLNVKFNPEAQCPIIKKFLEEVLYPEDVLTIQEWFGFCLFRKYFIKKAMILVGEKNTGKTVLLNLISKFFGEKNVTGINLQRISYGDKFAIASLKDKLVNIFDDLSAKDLDAGGFKVATGGGYITAEYKFGDSFQFMNFAKHIFATNKIPPVKDPNDDAYYERWLPIQLDNQINSEEQDPFLLNKLTTSEELSGLLNWALEGLRRLLNKGKFSYSKDSKQIKYVMERSSHPLATFVSDVLEQENGNKISKETMFQIYTTYCIENGLPRMSKSQLGRNLFKYAVYVIPKHEKERYWENVKIKNKYGGVRSYT